MTTTSPTYESMPHILCEVERHLSDSTNHMSESIQEGVSEPQHLVSEVVETACEATMISNNLTSTPSVFSLVLGFLHDDMPILDDSIPPMETMMAMVEDDAPPHGSIKMKMTMTRYSTPHLQHMSDAPNVTYVMVLLLSH